jgi:hypothetical protein
VSAAPVPGSWHDVVHDAVRRSTQAQGLPLTIEDDSVLEAVARVLDAPGSRSAL